MLFDPNVIEVEEQPVCIQFDDGKKRRHYTPDFLVMRKSKSSRLIEIKYAAELKEKADIFAPKFKAARRFAREKSWKFEIWTENEIRVPRFKNGEFLLPYRRNDPDSGICARILRCLETEGELTVDECLNICWPESEERARGLSALWFLLSVGRIHADFDIPIGNNSTIRIGESG